MSDPTAIGMVSESLRNLLVGEMTLTPPVDVTILAPDETGGERRVNLFLYRVQENTTLKNMDWQVKRGAPTQETPPLAPPPLSLNLHYLMTPYAQNDPLNGNATAHEILGEAMRVFHEHAIVPQSHLVAGLQDAREQIKIMLNPLDPDELGQVWSTFSQPFRLSVMYEVSVVQLELLGERPMAKRVERVCVPDIQAPFLPPVVDHIEPLHGPAGTVINVHVQHLSKWQAYVTVTGRTLTPTEPTGDTFQVTLPGDLPPGFHELRVDIAHLYRRVFFFEVTT